MTTCWTEAVEGKERAVVEGREGSGGKHTQHTDCSKPTGQQLEVVRQVARSSWPI